MKTIYKYELSPQDSSVKLPRGAKVLSVQTQFVRKSFTDKAGHVPFLWALVDTSQRMMKYDYRWIGTGWNLDAITDLDCYAFINTVQIPDTALGTLVFHFFIEEK